MTVSTGTAGTTAPPPLQVRPASPVTRIQRVVRSAFRVSGCPKTPGVVSA